MNEQQHTYEIVHFSFRKGLSPEEQQKLMEQFEPALRKLSGFIDRRYYFNASNNRWVDFVTWSDTASALAAAQQVMADPQLAPLFGAIEQTSIDFGHFTRLPNAPHL